MIKQHGLELVKGSTFKNLFLESIDPAGIADTSNANWKDRLYVDENDGELYFSKDSNTKIQITGVEIDIPASTKEVLMGWPSTATDPTSVFEKIVVLEENLTLPSGWSWQAGQYFTIKARADVIVTSQNGVNIDWTKSSIELLEGMSVTFVWGPNDVWILI